MIPGVSPAQIQQESVLLCAQCKNEIKIPLPEPQVINTKTISGMMFAHERLPICPHCNTAYMFLVNGLGPAGDIVFIWVPIPPQKPSSGLVTGTTDLDIKNAAANKERMEALLKNFRGGKQ